MAATAWIPLGLLIAEKMPELFVNAFDGPEKFLDPHGFPGDLVGIRSRDDRVAQLRGAANAFGGQQGENRLWILAAQLAFLPLLNGPRRLAHIVHRIPKFPEDVRVHRA